MQPLNTLTVQLFPTKDQTFGALVIHLSFSGTSAKMIMGVTSGVTANVTASYVLEALNLEFQ